MLTNVLLVIAVWFAVLLAMRWAVIPWLADGPGGDPVTGILWRLARLLVNTVHHPRFEGEDSIRDEVEAGPLVVISNHTGSVDPLLIQGACRFHIRWMMASNMMMPSLDWLWRQQQMIAVARDGTDSAPLREAIRHIRAGGVIGIFPEGGIVTPPRRVWPFYQGAGLLVTRTRARVLLVWVSGTPDTNDFMKSLATPCEARVRFVDLIDFGDERDPAVVTETLRARLAEASGWPIANERPDTPPRDIDPFGPRVAAAG